MCFETAGSDMSKREASSLIDPLPPASRARARHSLGVGKCASII